MKIKKLFFAAVLIFLAGTALAACNLPGRSSAASPTLNATQANLTAVARVTEFIMLTEAAQQATDESAALEMTPTPEETVTPDDLATPTETLAAPTARATATPVPCDLASAGNPIDITIPDDTRVVAGHVFTKTWRLINVGTCTWTKEYAVVWDSGAQIGQVNVVPLTGNVSPGQTVDISVVMVAPSSPDTYQSNWKLRNNAGVLFGIGSGSDAAFWVRIVVIPITATPTVTPTPTATPQVKVSGNSDLFIGDQLNLDNLLKNNADGTDMLFASDGGGGYDLTVRNATTWVLFGTTEPTYASCKSATLGSVPIVINNAAVGKYYCYKTSEGRLGWFKLNAYDSGAVKLTLQVVTWIPLP